MGLANAVLSARQENSVGLLGMTSSGCRLLCSPVGGGVESDALPKLSAIMHTLKPQGDGGDIVCALRTAQLAFKYAKSTEAGSAPERRAVLFLGSPVAAPKDALEKLGKELKKVNVSAPFARLGRGLPPPPPLPLAQAAVNAPLTPLYTPHAPC